MFNTKVMLNLVPHPNEFFDKLILKVKKLRP